MKILINNNEFTFLNGYQKNDKYRLAFNNLAIKVFNLSFEEWYQAGYMNEKYIPYTLFIDDKAIANISINIMNFISLGRRQTYLQIGTVMTDERYRKQGLSQYLMEIILNEWDKKCDFIYLYANHTVLDFYPKFGFEKMKEFSYFKQMIQPSINTHVEKLKMDMQYNRDKLYDYAKHTSINGKLTMKENADLIMFYCITVLKDHVYYIPSLDVMTVATYDHHQLLIWDIYSKAPVDIHEIISSLSNTQTDNVVLGFTPNDCGQFEIREVTEGDVLFIQKNKTALFNENKIMFPLLSHA